MFRKYWLGFLFIAIAVFLLIADQSSAQGRRPVRNLLFGGGGGREVVTSTAVCDPATGLCYPASGGVAVTAAPAVEAPPATRAAMAPAALPGERLFHKVVRLRVTMALVKQGKTFADARAMAASLDTEVINGAVDAVNAPVGSIGDGSILKTIIDFLNSPAGQALIQLLLGLLAGA